MKKISIFLFCLIPVLGFSQYVSIATHYDSETTAHHIIHGDVEHYLSDSVRYVYEKKSERYIIKENMTPEYVKCKLDKSFSGGKLEYVSRTNGGYTFTIAVVDNDDETNVVNYCTFKVNAYTGKITEVEILKGE